MKNKIFLLLFIPLLSLAQTQSKTTISVNANYHNRSCVGGVGLCSDSGSVVESKSANAVLEKTASNEIVMSFDLEKLSKSEITELNSENSISVSGSKNISLDKNILSKLDIDNQFSEIIVGSYPIQIVRNKVRITFTLSKKQR